MTNWQTSATTNVEIMALSQRQTWIGVMGSTDNFEWDDEKSSLNHAKHSLPLPVAIAIFDDPRRIEWPSQRSTLTETRFVTVGMAFGRILVCVYTWRGLRRRLISVRRAHRSERRAYEQRP
jgi:uncharacterized protein